MKAPISFAVALAICATAATQSVHAQQGPILKLDYDGQTECIFQTENGVSISGTNPGQITAAGDFISGCPTGGGATPPAAVSLTANPTTIDPGQSTTITWSATADLCRYNGSSLPAAVAGWPASGDACIGATECALGNSITPTLNTAGDYIFKLTCTSGASSGQLRTTAVQTATVQVTGTPPPTGNCEAPQGLTRQLTGRISQSSGGSAHSNVDYTQWGATFGWAISNPGDYHYTWPGFGNNDIRFGINENHYVALQFHVPANYPYRNPTTAFPYGKFSTNASSPDAQVWTISISETCGDFTPAPSGSRDYYCYQEFTPWSGALTWAVLPTSAQVPFFTCPLERDTTYYVNITTAPLGNPSQQQTNCSGDICNLNLKNGGSFEGTYEQIP